LAPEVARGRASLPSGSLAVTVVRSAATVWDGDRPGHPLGGTRHPSAPFVDGRVAMRAGTVPARTSTPGNGAG